MKSMTAFGRASASCAEQDLTVEVKSVNSRYFDCSVRLPHALAPLEERIKSYLRAEVISRGKVEVSVQLDTHAGAAGVPAIDGDYAAGYIAVLRDLRDRFGLADDISVMSVAANPAVFRTVREETDTELAWTRLAPVLTAAARSFGTMRASEGKKIGDDLAAKLAHVAACADEVEALSKADTVGYRDKLEARLRALLADNRVTIDENRILTECAIYADRIAVDEELVRLRSHFAAFREIAAEKTPSGKKLDFLMQEMNRETNTIGSKASNAAVARLVVEMKNELEKIREQVQNIE